MHLLTINAGSASLRLAAFRATPDGLERVAADHSDAPLDDPVAAIEAFVTRHELPRPAAVAHRLVHGGGRWTEPCLIDAQDEADLRQLVPLAPLHMPPALAAMAASRKLFGTRTAQVAVFDTAFFQELPEVAAVYALPAELSSRLQLRRYGFHGIAHAALWRRWSEIGRGDRLVSLQLGSGSSITATRNGKPLDTSMGFTPLEGLVMATRCGDLDPGLLLHLQANGLDSEALTDTLYRRSGLLGVSGISGDMRELLGADDAAARLAIALYCYRARKYLGAYLTVLGGADGILFGGGGCLLAGLQLPGGRHDLPARQPAAARTAASPNTSSAIARPLGRESRLELRLGASEPADQQIRPGCDLHRRPRSWRARHAGAGLSGRHLYSEVYPNKSEDLEGMRQFFKEFSFPGGIGSHCTPETPGSIHEGGELGYSVSHAFGAAYDNPDLLVAVMVGDGEAETAPLATSWHSNKFLNPIRDGAVLPILHLNGYKINNPTILARISHEELENLFKGYGWTPHFVEGSDPLTMHARMAEVLEQCVLEIRRVQAEARASGIPGARAGR
jgi:hypothetical protein